MVLAVKVRSEPLPQEISHGLCVGESREGRNRHVRFKMSDVSVLHHVVNRTEVFIGVPCCETFIMLCFWPIIVMTLYGRYQYRLFATEGDRGQVRMAAGCDAIYVLTFEMHVRPFFFWLLHQHAE